MVDATVRFTNWHFRIRDYLAVCTCLLKSTCYRVMGIRVCALDCLRGGHGADLVFAILEVWFTAALTVVDTMFCGSSFWTVSLAHGPRWLFLLSRYRQSIFCCC